MIEVPEGTDWTVRIQCSVCKAEQPVTVESLEVPEARKNLEAKYAIKWRAACKHTDNGGGVLLTTYPDQTVRAIGPQPNLQEVEKK
jgi:hypothetical protein